MLLDESLFPRSGVHAVVSATMVTASSQGLREQKRVMSNKSAEKSLNSLCECQAASCDN